MSEATRLAGEWLQYALDDLVVAEGHLANEAVPPRYVCYQSQQAAEKALKALLVARRCPRWPISPGRRLYNLGLRDDRP
jgi:HEPN domain-containing protein